MKPHTDKDWIISRLLRAMVRSSDQTLKCHPDFTKTVLYLIKHSGEDELSHMTAALSEEDTYIRALFDANKRLKAENESLKATLTKTFEALQATT